MSTQKDWSQPHDLDELERVFGANALDFMPTREEIPEDFWRRRTEWNRIQSAWFFNGLPDTVEFVPKSGVDTKTALRHLGAVQGSWAPKHEHKEAAVAWLMSLWFKKVKGWEQPRQKATR